METKIVVLTAIVALGVCACVTTKRTVEGLTDVLAPGAKLHKLADGLKFAEGATANAAGELFFTDQPNDRILKWTEKDGLTTFLQPAGRANGMCFAPDGSLLVCADERTALWAVAPDGAVTLLADRYDGKKFNGPNDVWATPDGNGCYFTDPFYARSWWNYTAAPQPTQQVYYLTKGGKPRRVTDDLVQPNGVVGTADGRMLYVSDLGADKTYSYAILSDGSLVGRTVFCKMGSDGMALDNDGNVYLTGKGVHVYAPDGRKLGVIKVPEAWCGNVCVGGPDRKTLFITASHGLYAIRLR